MKAKETMEDLEALESKIYQHKDKNVGKNGYPHDGKYRIIREARMKNHYSGEWLDCVIYQDISNKSLYVREKNDFYNKFI